MEYKFGLDSTDSIDGGCTTWTFSRLLDALFQRDDSLRFLDYPRLIRLNPNIPDKTRGNASLAAHIKSNLSSDEIFNTVIPIIEKDTLQYGTKNKNPGFVLSKGVIKQKWDYNEALQCVIDQGEIAQNQQGMYFWPNINQAHIGAIAAILASFESDFTYELIGYRRVQNFGKERKLNLPNLIQLINEYPSTFSSYDFEGRRELIAPSGPDPIFCGIRGDKVSDLRSLFRRLQIDEPLASWTIFKTNQGTNAHVERTHSSLMPYTVISTRVTVISKPIEHRGGHVKIQIRISNSVIECIAFEPTKTVRDAVRELLIGDSIFIHGNVKNNEFGLHIALEFFSIAHLQPDVRISSPLCSCGKRMTSAGKFKGYKCRDCNNKSTFGYRKVVPRKLFLGQKVFASLSAQRHLTRPLKRIHLRNQELGYELYYSDFRMKFD
ncbi:MAG: TiaS agmantine-binding domain-containing protein [Candidatus Kariarchaeaceae archaeon]